jgi:hypothetical protein
MPRRRSTWQERVRQAFEELREARAFYEHCRDDANAARNYYAEKNFWRVLRGQQPLSREAWEAQMRLDEYCEDYGPFGDHDRAAWERHDELQSAVTEAECRSGIHRYCVHEEAHDDTEHMHARGWAGRPVGQVWGVVNPDGTVTAKGFLDDPEADADQAVHPVGSLAYYHAEAGTWVHSASGQTVDEQRRIDAERAERDTTTPPAETPMTVIDAYQQVKTGVVDSIKTNIVDGVTGPVDKGWKAGTEWKPEHDTTPTASPAGAGTGGGTVSFEEDKVAITSAQDQANQANGGLQQASQDVQEAITQLAGLGDAGGTASAAVAEAIAAYTQALERISEAQQQIQAGDQAAGSALASL